MLWIALKSWYLWYSEQHNQDSLRSNTRCELLSKVDIFDIRNNVLGQHISLLGVVNCSQKLISLIFGTTYAFFAPSMIMLWIALKSWYLWYSEQLATDNEFRILVVNCSQKLISLIFGTTYTSTGCCGSQLWIALKSWYLWYSEQPWSITTICNPRCELLSKVDIFDIRNNLILFIDILPRVVNCSQKLISLIFGTTGVWVIV